MVVYDVNDEGEAVGSVPYRTVSGERRFTAKPTSAGQVLGYASITPPVLGPVSLDNTYLANRTRFVFIPAKDFEDALTGTPAYGSYGLAQVNFYAWALDGTADEAVGADVFMPVDWNAGNINPFIVWSPSDTNSGNVNWIVRITSIAEGDVFNAALESTSGALTSAASGTQYGRITKDMGSIAPGTGTAASWLKLLVYRFSSDAADTYNAHDALFRGVVIQYTADS